LADEEGKDAPKKRWLEGLQGGEADDTRAMQWFKFLFPIGLTLLVVFIIFLLYPYDRWYKWARLAFLYLVPPAGKESIIPWGIAEGYHPLAMAGTVLLMDVVCALFIAWNFPLAKRIPFLGYYIDKVEKTGSKKLEGNAALQAGAWIGMVLFVMVPFQGSGGVTASIIGKAVGMRVTHLVSAVAVGAIVAGTVIALVGTIILDLLRENLVTGVIAILVVVAVLVGWYLFRRWQKAAKKENAEVEAGCEAEAGPEVGVGSEDGEAPESEAEAEPQDDVEQKAED
jgi:uncharacterized membrane protein